MEVEYKDTVYEFPDNTEQDVIMSFLAQNNQEFEETQDDVEGRDYVESLESGQPLPPPTPEVEPFDVQFRSQIKDYELMDKNYIKGLGMIESTDNPNAVSSSGAVGLYQFLEKTWLNTVKAYAPDFYKAYSKEELLEFRKDREISTYFADKLTRENAANLQKRGADTSGKSLYLAHFLGVGEASKVLLTQPNTPIEKVVSEKSRKNNPNVFKNVKTAGDLIMWSDSKVKQYVP